MKIFDITRYGAFLTALSAMFLISSCTKDFEEVNTNKLLPDDHQKTLDGLASGGLFPGLIQRVVPTRTSGQDTDLPNRYQIAQNISGDNWVGYYSPGHNKWNSGKNYTSYFVITGWANYHFETGIELIVNPYLEIKAATHEVEVADDNTLIYHKKDMISQSSYAIAQIIKIFGFHRTADTFGPIPYNKIGAGKLQVPYDSQEQVYRSFLSELDEAVTTLNQYVNSGGSKIIEDYDPIYQGDVAKWIKLGNSLMLRLAIRVYYADAALSTQYVQKAFTNEGGLLQDKNDIAKLVSNGSFIYINSVELLWNAYNDVKMGATIYSYLTGYNDARIGKYFSKSTGGTGVEGYYAVRSGIVPLSDASTYSQFSVPNIQENTPTYWMKASEVQFLLAEAALHGIVAGDPKTYYENGIKLSFEENDLSPGDYATTSAVPANYVDNKNAENNVNAASTIDKKWMDAGSDEEKLEQIITQKYLAIYPDGQEAWSEWRRTGYPRMFKVPSNVSNVSAQNVNNSGTDGGMRRLPFPESEIRLNPTNVSNAKTLLSGPDNAATNVWWDKKSKN